MTKTETALTAEDIRREIESDFYKVHDGLAALQLHWDAIANGPNAYSQNDIQRALNFILRPMEEACERMGRVLHLLDEQTDVPREDKAA